MLVSARCICWPCLPICPGSSSKICWILGYTSTQYRGDGDSIQVDILTHTPDRTRDNILTDKPDRTRDDIFTDKPDINRDNIFTDIPDRTIDKILTDIPDETRDVY